MTADPAELDVNFVGWEDTDRSLPRATYSLEKDGENVVTLTVGLPETVRARLEAEHRGADEPREQFAQRVREALRRYGLEVADELTADRKRLLAARQAGLYDHEVGGHELGRLTAQLT